MKQGGGYKNPLPRMAVRKLGLGMMQGFKAFGEIPAN